MMKKYLSILVLLLLGVSCNTIPDQDEIVQNMELQTKSVENPQRFTFTITSNISDDIVISRVIKDYLITEEDHFIFSGSYQDFINEGQSFLLLPDPVEGKVWTGVRGNNIWSYDTTVNNKYQAPYLEGYADQDINIELIYRDIISHSGGSHSGSGGSSEDNKDDERYQVYKMHYYSMMKLPNNYYELTFKLESGMYDPGSKVEINPLIGEKGILAEYQYWDQLTQRTTLEPHYDYFTLKIPASTSRNKTLYVTIPHQRNTKKHWEIVGSTTQFNL